MTQRRAFYAPLLRLVLLLVVAFAALPGSRGIPVASAATNTLHIKVVSARDEPKFPNGAPTAPGVIKGAPITQYKFIINEDNTGDPAQPRSPNCSPSSASYPANCRWPSIQAMTGSSPIVTQGDQTILDDVTHGLNLPAGKYLISVMAENYKLDGAHFTIPLPNNDPVQVELQPLPLPTATLRAQVFEDNAPTNSAPDLPAEHGLAGFRAAITDSLGEVTTDVFGNPLCTEYEADSNGQIILDADGRPTPISGTGGSCISDANGIIEIPNLGPNRYAMAAIPPDGSNWVQTTTLEGNHDWDTWLQEGATGNDTEFAIAGEPFPFTIAGFVKPTALPTGGTGEIKGVVDAVKVYVPLNGGLPYNGGIWGGLSGAKIDHPIENPWIALSSLQNGDQAVYVGQGNANGSFDIKNVPPGDYILTYWDEPQNYILDLVQVTVKPNEVVDVGNLFLTGWFTKIDGYVFNDANANGKRDAGETGIANYVVALKRRTNTLMDRGSISVVTGPDGHYVMENVYPLTQWLVLEAYNDRYYTTGVTYQADNQPQPTTVLGAGVDVNVLPIIGQSGRLDWGVKQYGRTENGGIVGTVSYDTTRNELDPRFAAVENWQPGIPGLNVRLYQPVVCTGAPGEVCDADGIYQLDPANDYAYAKGQLLNSYVTETWERPKDCQARDVDGKPVDQQVLPPATGGYDCLEGPLMGVQFDEEFATVDGNYGFGDGCFNGTLDDSDPSNPTCVGGTFEALTAGDYLVDVEIPNDAFGKSIYQVTREEDINVFGGDQYVPQIPPPACAGPLHTVDVAGVGTDGYSAVTTPEGALVPASTPMENPTFADGGGSPYEGQQKPLCSTKLVTLSNGRSIAPTFNLFTDVPVPGRFFGYIVDDLNLSTNPQDLLFGEKAGVANSPIGIYDFSNRLVTTVQSDPNGIFDVLLPSTTTINCPSPSGVCTNLYRMVGNDPGVPGALNPNYNPQFRTIAATFELFPGDIIPADLAPTQVGVSIQGPGSQFNSAVTCALDVATPQLFAVSNPYAANTVATSITIKGTGFGATQGAGRVRLGTTTLTASSWSDRQIGVTVPAGITAGAYQLTVTANNGQSTVNGLTFHVRGTGYNPRLLTVQKPNTAFGSTNFRSIQEALDAAAATAQNTLVVVYPGGVPDASNPAYNPRKAYFENIIIQSPVKLQGVGPGGVYPDKSVVDGSIIDGGAFGGDTALATAWRTKVGSLTWVGNQNPYEGQTVYLLARTTSQWALNPAYRPAIDGFSIQGGDQQGFPNNINEIGGTPTGLPATVQTQGGGIFANAYVRSLQITNNILQNNGGSYGGAIRIGTPDLPAPGTNSHNENLRIANNRVIANGGTNLAGGIGIFAGTDNYEIASNDICGNFSAEYGGAISHYGLSAGGTIHHNRIYFNRSYDEGGAIMIAGQLPANPNTLSPGSGAVDIYNNLIQGNLANDDGGGIRFLMAGNFPFNVFNNMIVNNISTHEGGGIALDDAPNVRVYNNTIMKNITTATAATSNGLPAPAGLSTTGNSTLLQVTLPGTAPVFSKPLLFNNIFWDNRAGSWNGGGVAGIGLTGDATPIDYWDLGVADGAGLLDPTNSIVQQSEASHPYTTSATNSNANPAVAGMYDMSVAVFPWRTNPNFVNAAIVAVEAPPNLLGNYHLQAGSPALNAGASAKAPVNAPGIDIDNQIRPGGTGYDIGADEADGTTGAGAFPATPVLDDFNRSSQSVATALGSNWAGQTGNYIIPSISSGNGNQLQTGSGGYVYWNASGSTFGANQEVYYTFNKVSATASEQDLLLKANNLTGTGGVGNGTSMIEVWYNRAASQVRVLTFCRNVAGCGTQNWRTRLTINAVTFAPGDQFGARALADGTVNVYKNGALIGTVNVTSDLTPWPAALALSGGKVGIWLIGTSGTAAGQVRIDNFGGGSF